MPTFFLKKEKTIIAVDYKIDLDDLPVWVISCNRKNAKQKGEKMSPNSIAFLVGLLLSFIVAGQGLLTKNGRNTHKEYSLSTDYIYSILVMAVVFWAAMTTRKLYGPMAGLLLIVGYWVVFPLLHVRHQILKKFS